MRSIRTRSIGIGLLIISAILYMVTYSFKNESVSLGGADYGPTFFPRAILIVIGILSFMLVIIGWKEKAHIDETSNCAQIKIDDSVPGEEHQKAVKLVFYILGITLLYLLIMQPVGYLISTIAYTFFSIWLLRPRPHLHILWLLAGSIVFAFGMQYLFGTVMNVLLPLGLLK